jgi:hypothetical protein
MGDELNSLVADWGPLSSQSRNRRLTDIVAARHAALCLAFCKPLPCLLLLMWGEGGLAAEFDAFGLGVGPAPRRALGDAAAFELRGNAKHGKNKLGEIGRGIDNRLGNRTQARPGALHVASDHQKVGRVTLA